MTRLTSYKGRNALITGASSGIGRLLALRMADAGARVALVARREAELEALAGEIRSAGGEAVSLVCDVGDRDQALAAAGRAVERVGVTSQPATAGPATGRVLTTEVSPFREIGLPQDQSPGFA